LKVRQHLFEKRHAIGDIRIVQPFLTTPITIAKTND
jgi:hypothetical protein